MTPSFKVDESSLRRFHEAVKAYASTSNRSLKDIINQKLLDVAVTAFQVTRPQTAGTAASLQFQRTKVHEYLWRQMATYVKLAKRGHAAGRFIRRKGSIKSKKQLYLVNLLVNKIRGRQGRKGLYKTDMAQASGAFARRSQVSVGYLKSVWLPVIRGLLPFANYRKYSWSALATGLSRWKGSKGYETIASPANAKSLYAVVDIRTKVRGPRQQLARQYQVDGANLALQAEANDLLRRAIEQLSKAPSKQ